MKPNPQITKQFKKQFNELLIEINKRQDGSGRFSLNRQFDNSLYSVIEKSIALCDQYKADQLLTNDKSVNFMDICKVEY